MSPPLGCLPRLHPTVPQVLSLNFKLQGAQLRVSGHSLAPWVLFLSDWAWQGMALAWDPHSTLPAIWGGNWAWGRDTD